MGPISKIKSGVYTKSKVSIVNKDEYTVGYSSTVLFTDRVSREGINQSELSVRLSVCLSVCLSVPVLSFEPTDLRT